MTVLRIPRTSQPQWAVSVDKRFNHAWLPSQGMRDSVGTAHASGFGLSVGPKGVELLTNDSYPTCNIPSTDIGSTFTEVIVARITSLVSPLLFGVAGASYTVGGYTLVLSGGVFYTSCNGGSNTSFTGAVIPSAGEYVVFVVRRQSGAVPSLFINGKKYSGAAAVTGGLIADRISSGGARGYSTTALIATAPTLLSDAEIKSLSDNPWAIFAPIQRPIYVSEVAGGGTGNATGTLASVSISAPSATADSGVSPGNASGSLSSITIGAATATASGKAIATGSLSAVTLNPATATATGKATATGALASITVSPATATANATGAGAASGSLSSVTLAAPSATATGKAIATGSLASVSLAAPTATASNITTGNAFANFMAVVLSPIEGFATGGASAFASLDSVTIAPPTASASGAVTATIARPASDISAGSWLPSSVGAGLFEMVDEVTPDPLDYIYATSVGTKCEMALNTTAYPGSTTSQQLKYRASSSTGNSVIVRLKQGATTIRSETQPLTALDTEYTIALTVGEIAAITSGSVSVELESA